MGKKIWFSVILATACDAQSLWRETRYGMNAAELMKIFGPRLRPAQRDIAAAPNHVYCAYTLQDRLCAVPVEVCFLFAAGKPWDYVTNVELATLVSKNSSNFVTCTLSEYERAYGAPVRVEQQSDAPDLRYEYVKGNTYVFLDITRAKDEALILVRYATGPVFVEPPEMRYKWRSSQDGARARSVPARALTQRSRVPSLRPRATR
jgi:hypothetical protein